MQRTLECLPFKTTEPHLKRGGRAWKKGWPDGMWIEMCIDNQCKFVIHRDGTYEPWRPTLNDYADAVWFVRTD